MNTGDSTQKQASYAHQLRNPGDVVIGSRLPVAMNDELSAEAQRLGVTRSSVIAEAVRIWLEQRAERDLERANT